MNSTIQFTGLLSEPYKARSRVKVAILTVLSMHAAVFAFLLLQGCQQDGSNLQEVAATPNLAPAGAVTNPTVLATTEAPVAPAYSTAVLAPSNPPAVSPVFPPPARTEYTVARGDSLGKVAKLHHTTAKAIIEANPGVEPTQLQIGQVIHLPRTVDSTAANAARTASDSSQAAMAMNSYTIKPGDRLPAIAAQFHTTVGAIRAANGLYSRRMYVGLKLNIPARSSIHTVASTTPVLSKLD